MEEEAEAQINLVICPSFATVSQWFEPRPTEYKKKKKSWPWEGSATEGTEHMEA